MIPNPRVGMAAAAALLFFSLSCDKGGSKSPVEPVYQEPKDGAISGTVTVEGVGLEGTQVTLAGPESRSTSTDVLGAFSFSQLTRGTYTVTLGGFDPAFYAFAVTTKTASALGGSPVAVEFTGTLVPQPPAAASALTAEALGSDSVALTWTDQSDDETGFQVERRAGEETEWIQVGSVGPDTVTYVDEGLSPATTYTYRVKACNDVGCSAPSEEASATTDEVPPVAPGELAAEADGPFAMRLTWTDNSHNEMVFEVEGWAEADSAWVLLDSVGADTASFSHTELTPATTYTYRIRACNDVGCSDYAQEASGTTDDVPPEAPSGLDADPDGPAAIDLDWTDRSDNEDEFEIERKEGADGSWSQVGTAEADKTRYEDGGLSPTTTYTYRIRACNEAGCSEYSAESSATTTEMPPTAPSGLTASATGTETIDLGWTDESDNETEFRLDRREEPSGTWSQVATPAADAAAWEDTGLSPGTEYSYRLRACNAGGCSAYSNEARATTDGVPTGLNLMVERLYITQSTQTLGGGVPLVADKAGYLRVFAVANEGNDAKPDVRVRLYHWGNLVHTEVISAPGSSVPTGVFENTLAASWNYRIPSSLVQPGLSVLADVDPGDGVAETDEGDNAFPASGSPGNIDVRVSPTFDVTFIPIRQSVNNLVGNVSSGNAGGFLDDAKTMLPLVNSDTDIHAEYVTDAPELEADNATSTWQTVLGEIQALRVAEGSSRYYFGVVKTTYNSGVAGMGYLGWPAAIGWDRLPSASGVAAHEWGHNWNLRHAPGCGAGSPDPNFPYADGKIGVWGLDVGPASLKSPSTYYDFMSYCGPDWVSDYMYEKVLDYREAQGANRAPDGQPTASLLIWGRVDKDGIVLEPAFQLTTRAVLPTGDGEYTLEGLGGGKRLFAMAFDPIPIPDAEHGAGTFAFAIPLDLLGGKGLETLRVSGGGRPAATTSSRGGAQLAAPADPRLVVSGGTGLELTWDGRVFPMAMVRDPATGEVLSFGRGGEVHLPVAPREVEVLFSDGLRSPRPIRKVVR